MGDQKMENKYFQSAREKAQYILKDRSRLRILLSNASKKISQTAVENLKLDKLAEKIMIIIRMIKAYINGEYRVIPWKALVVLVAALVYFVTPLDLIPDFIPITGYLDDFTVILWVFRSLQNEIQQFMEWETANS